MDRAEGVPEVISRNLVIIDQQNERKGKSTCCTKYSRWQQTTKHHPPSTIDSNGDLDQLYALPRTRSRWSGGRASGVHPWNKPKNDRRRYRPLRGTVQPAFHKQALQPLEIPQASAQAYRATNISKLLLIAALALCETAALFAPSSAFASYVDGRAPARSVISSTLGAVLGVILLPYSSHRSVRSREALCKATLSGCGTR